MHERICNHGSGPAGHAGLAQEALPAVPTIASPDRMSAFAIAAEGSNAAAANAWLATDTQCGALIAARDWAATPLGPIAGWPPTLRTMLGFVLRSPVPLIMFWSETGIMLYNDAYSVFAAGRHPDTLGMPVGEGWPEVADFTDNVMRVVLAGGTLTYKDHELTLFRRGVAEQVLMTLDYSPIVGDDGNAVGILGVVAETSDRLHAEQRQYAAEVALTAERDRARDVLANMAEGFVLFDHDFRIVDINAEALRLDRRGRDQVVGLTQAQAWPETVSSEVGRLSRQTMRDRKPATLEHRYQWDGDHVAWLDMRLYPTADGFAMFYKDVTARREAQHAAADAAERVQLALDAGAIIGTWVWDVPGNRFIADDRFAASFSLDPEACRTGVPLDYVAVSIHPDDRQCVADTIAETMARGGRYQSQYRVMQNDGRYRWVEANGRVEFGPGGTASRFPGVLIDIDARRAIEAERDRAMALLRTFAEAVPGVVYAKDRGGRLIIGNNGASALIGKPPADYLGRTDLDVLEDKDQARQVMANDRRIMESGVAEQLEEAVRLPDGTAAIWLSTKAPLRNDAGDVIGLVGSSIDITARIEAEQALETALKTSDVLLHEVNHRVKNSLQIVTSLLMLQARQATDPALRQSLMEARGRIAVIAGMHQRLYSTSQHDRVNFGNYVCDLASETLLSLGGGNRIRFETQIEPGIVIVLNQAVSLALVVTELVTNAIKYAFPFERDGKICLTLERIGENIVLTVADNGIGLPPGFDPALRTSLGMKIVTALVRQVRGKIIIGSGEPGATFRIDIPMAKIL